MKSILVALVALVSSVTVKADLALPVTQKLIKVYAYDNVRNIMGIIESDMVGGTSILFDKQVASFREARMFLRTLNIKVPLENPDATTDMTYKLLLKDARGQVVLESQKTSRLSEAPDGSLHFAPDAFRLPRLSVAENVNILLNWHADRIRVLDSTGNDIGSVYLYKTEEGTFGLFPSDIGGRYPIGSVVEFQFDGYESIYVSLETGEQVNAPIPPAPVPPTPEPVIPDFGELEVEGLLDLTPYLEEGFTELTVSITQDTVIAYHYSNSSQHLILDLDADGVLIYELDGILVGDTHVSIEPILAGDNVSPEGIQAIQFDGDLEEVGVNHFYLLRTIRR